MYSRLLALDGTYPDPVLTESGCVSTMRKLTDQVVRQIQGGKMGFPGSQSKLMADCTGFTGNIYYSSGGWNVQGYGAARVDVW